jgi:hypothetical protein
MPKDNRWWLILVVILLMPLSGCESSRQSSLSSLSDNSRFMNLWNTYTHCSQDENPDVMRADAQRLSRVADTIHSDAASILPESHDPFRAGPTVRLSIDPAAMAAACALHAGQVAQRMGRLYVAREMFRMVVLHFPQPRYQYYAAQARLGLERLDIARRVCRKLPHLVTRCQHDI